MNTNSNKWNNKSDDDYGRVAVNDENENTNNLNSNLLRIPNMHQPSMNPLRDENG